MGISDVEPSVALFTSATLLEQKPIQMEIRVRSDIPVISNTSLVYNRSREVPRNLQKGQRLAAQQKRTAPQVQCTNCTISMEGKLFRMAKYSLTLVPFL